VYKIDEITAVYDDKKQFFIDKLSEGVARIAAGFYPNDVIVRLPISRRMSTRTCWAGSLRTHGKQPHDQAGEERRATMMTTTNRPLS